MSGRTYRGQGNEDDAVPLEDHTNPDDGIRIVRPNKMSGCPKTWKVAVAILLVCALFLIGVVIGYCVSQAGFVQRLAPSNNCEQQDDKGQSSQGALSAGVDHERSDYDDGDPRKIELRHKTLVEVLHAMNYTLSEDLMIYAHSAILTREKKDRDLLDIVHDELLSLSFDDISIETYNILLSEPDIVQSNFVRVFYGNNTNMTLEFDGVKNRAKTDHSPGFVAYSPSADVHGELINVNYGTYDDFAVSSPADLSGKIALVKAGQTSLEHKVTMAARYKMLGLLVYEESDAPHHGHRKCSQHAPFAVLGITANGGDPGSPGIPALKGIWSLPPDQVKLAPLPVRTISCQAARSLLPLIRSAANISRSQSSSHLTVQVSVSAKLVSKPIQNIVATIFGERDSDQSVIIGASRNSGEPGASVNATDLLLKLANGLSAVYRNRDDLWVPKRTIRLVSWGAADINQMGAVEFVEKYSKIWRNSIVAYVDLDRPVELGRSSEFAKLVSTSSPSLEELIETLASRIRDQDADFPDMELERMYRFKSKALVHTDHPLRTLLGVPYYHLRVVLPATLETAKTDAVMNGVLRMAGLVAVTLADSGIFQLRLHRSVQELVTATNRVLSTYGALIPNATADELRSAFHQLRRTITQLESYVANHLAYHRPEDVRMANGVILHFESIVSRLTIDAVDLLDRFPLARDNSLVDFDDRTYVAGCAGERPVLARFLHDVSLLLTDMLSVSRMISLKA